MNFGIIAEDVSDVAVIREITSRLLYPKRVGFKSFLGHGCGKLRRKCSAWADNLVRQGCSWIVVVHDLDRADQLRLRRELEEAIRNVRVTAKIVLIPIREIESWLMYDSRALGITFNGRLNARLPSNPEALQDPKKTLERFVWRVFRKEYFHTIHNQRIAQNIDPGRLRHAGSFVPYPVFVANVKQQVMGP